MCKHKRATANLEIKAEAALCPVLLLVWWVTCRAVQAPAHVKGSEACQLARAEMAAYYADSGILKCALPRTQPQHACRLGSS